MAGMDIYSKDLRIRALAAVDRGMPRREVVEIFSVSLTTLKRWLKMRREGKNLSPGLSTGRQRRILSNPEEKRLLWEQLQENDDAGDNGLFRCHTRTPQVELLDLGSPFAG